MCACGLVGCWSPCWPAVLRVCHARHACWVHAHTGSTTKAKHLCCCAEARLAITIPDAWLGTRTLMIISMHCICIASRCGYRALVSARIICTNQVLSCTLVYEFMACRIQWHCVCDAFTFAWLAPVDLHCLCGQVCMYASDVEPKACTALASASVLRRGSGKKTPNGIRPATFHTAAGMACDA
jgi:hypothetical protein